MPPAPRLNVVSASAELATSSSADNVSALTSSRQLCELVDGLIATATHPTRAPAPGAAPGAGPSGSTRPTSIAPGIGISTSIARCSPRALSPAAASAARQSAGARAPAGSGDVAIPPRIPIIAGDAPSGSSGPVP